MTWWDLFFRLPSGFPGGRIRPRLPRWPFCHLPGASQERHPPTVPRRRRVTSRSAKKGRRLRQTSPPAFAGGAEWCYLDMWISTRGVEGLHQKVDDRKRFLEIMCQLRKKSQQGRSAPLSKRCETRILATRPRHRFQEVLYTKKGPRQRKSSRKNYLWDRVIARISFKRDWKVVMDLHHISSLPLPNRGERMPKAVAESLNSMLGDVEAVNALHDFTKQFQPLSLERLFTKKTTVGSSAVFWVKIWSSSNLCLGWVRFLTSRSF